MAVALALVFGASGNATLSIFVLIIGLMIATPAGAAAAAAGWIGWFLGKKARRPALGAFVGGIALAAGEASLILLPLDGFTEFVIWFGVAGTAAAAVVFFFEVRWHHAATETPVAA